MPRERKQEHGKRRAQNAAVKRHAAIPHRRNGERVGDIIGEIIEEHVADTATKHDAERCPDDEIIERFRCHGRLVVGPQAMASQELLAVPPGEHDADDIAEAVPVHCQRPDAENHRIDIGKASADAGSNVSIMKSLRFVTEHAGPTLYGQAVPALPQMAVSGLPVLMYS